MALDFPSSPTNGQIYNNYYYDSIAGAWRSLSSTVNPIPSTLKNLTASSDSTTGVSLKVTPFTTSSVNLQEWYNTSSTVVASMNVAGDLTANSITLTTDLSVANGGTGASIFMDNVYLKGNGVLPITGQSGIPAGDITSGQLASTQGGVPTGAINQFAGSSAPSGWLMCQGQQLAIASYTELYNIITSAGTVFPYGANTNGSGSAGTTHFRLPDLQGRVPVAPSGSTGRITANNTLGAVGGIESVTLTAAQSGIPAHSHPNTLSDPSHAHPPASGHSSIAQNTYPTATSWYFPGGSGYLNANAGNTGYATTGITINNANNSAANASQSHTNLQPYIVVNYIIKT